MTVRRPFKMIKAADILLIMLLILSSLSAVSCSVNSREEIECAGYSGTELKDEGLLQAIRSGEITDASDIIYNFPKRKPGSNPRSTMDGYTLSWLNTACAIQLEIIDMTDLYGYYGFPDSDDRIDRDNIKKAGKVLEDQWGIKGREDLIGEVGQLLGSGDRKEYARFAAQAKQQGITGPGGRTLDDYRKAAGEKNPSLGKSDVAKMAYAAYRYANDGLDSIEFWDYSGALDILGLGCVCGYISLDEYVFQSVPLGAMIQRDYDSWEEAGQVYLYAYEYTHNLDIGSNDIDYMMRKTAYNMLCGYKNSSYNSDDFNAELTSAIYQD